MGLLWLVLECVLWRWRNVFGQDRVWAGRPVEGDVRIAEEEDAADPIAFRQVKRTAQMPEYAECKEGKSAPQCSQAKSLRVQFELS
jgi:hypothetical protein